MLMNEYHFLATSNEPILSSGQERLTKLLFSGQLEVVGYRWFYDSGGDSFHTGDPGWLLAAELFPDSVSVRSEEDLSMAFKEAPNPPWGQLSLIADYALGVQKTGAPGMAGPFLLTQHFPQSQPSRSLFALIDELGSEGTSDLISRRIAENMPSHLPAGVKPALSAALFSCNDSVEAPPQATPGQTTDSLTLDDEMDSSVTVEPNTPVIRDVMTPLPQVNLNQADEQVRRAWILRYTIDMPAADYLERVKATLARVARLDEETYDGSGRVQVHCLTDSPIPVETMEDVFKKIDDIELFYLSWTLADLGIIDYSVVYHVDFFVDPIDLLRRVERTSSGVKFTHQEGGGKAE